MNKNLINAFASVVMIVLAMYLAITGKPKEMALIIIACSICIAFLNIDSIQRFKGAGFEAQMRDTIKEANATVDQLRKLAAASTESTLTTSMAGNFFDGTTLETRVALHDKLVKTLVDLGVPKKQIDESRAMWKKGVGVIYHRGIRYRLLGKHLNSPSGVVASPDAIQAAKEIQDMLRFETWDAPSSKTIRAFLKNKKLITSEITSLLDDYAHFEKTGNLQNRDLFVTL